MKINHNIQALNAYRNLYQNQMRTAGNLEKLSSGLRINRAADDAAGLAISEKMRSQIRGLKQAERNALDGISLIQTSEGAMNEIHSMLQRMRELAVQAANDTNTTEDRKSIQNEIDQLLKEIDSVSKRTEFNTRRLLDGSSAVDTEFLSGGVSNNTNLLDTPLATDPSLKTGTYQVTVTGTPTYELSINQPGAGVTDPTIVDVSGIGGSLPLGEYTIEISNYQKDGSGVETATIEIFNPDGESVGTIAASIGANGSVQTVGDSASGKSLDIDTSKITTTGKTRIQIEAKVDVSIQYSETGATYTPITSSKELTSVNGELEHGGLVFTYGTSVSAGTSKFLLTNKALVFQIGANAGQTVNIDIPELSTKELGINDIDLSSHESANDAIRKLDEAITRVSAVRAKLGAMQNRLDHTISNLQTTHENLTASESRIRDTDMALEMTEFTKNNILNQSAQAMLAQANQLPQGVLQLLQ